MIPQQEIDRIKQQYDIVSVVKRFIELDSKNTACCPFHNEKSGSFKVNPNLQSYKCFGCGAGGDIFSFVQAIKAVNFKEAAEIITGHVIEETTKGLKNGRGIFLSDEMADGKTESKPEPQQPKKMNKFAALWESRVEKFTDEYVESVALNRDIDQRVFQWLKKEKLIGLFNGHVAFPVFEDGEVVRCHVKDHDNNTWYYDPKGGNSALIIGDPKSANTTFILESQWDAFAVMSALQHWDHADAYAYIITRGASSNTDVSKHVSPGGKTILIPQNDPEDKRDSTGKTPAEKWLERCKASIPVNVTAYVAETPKEYKDPNDWISKENPSESDVKKQFTELIHTPESNPKEKNPLTFEFIRADDLAEEEGAFDFVEDVLSDGCASVIYGASNSGKTFFAIDLGAHVATGREWQGKEVEQGAVIYIALEGRTGAVNRIKAMKARGILPKGAPFFLCFSPVNLLDTSHPAAVKRMIENVSAAAGIRVRLVIIDTMARAMAGGDENSGEDMGEAVKSIDAIKEATGAHVCVIHHSGKDLARGARGHSCLRAAIDTEIEVVHPEGDKYRVATVVKQRDLPTIARLCFSLEVVEVGTNRRGKPITSCVVKTEDEIMIPAKGKPGAKPKYTFEMILELLPQPSIKAWQLAAKESHGMGKDSFDGYKSRCASQWEKTKQGGIVKTLELLPSIENRGNGGNAF